MVFASNTHKKLYQEIEQLTYEAEVARLSLYPAQVGNAVQQQVFANKFARLQEKNNRAAFLSSLFAQHYSETDVIYWLVAGEEAFYESHYCLNPDE